MPLVGHHPPPHPGDGQDGLRETIDGFTTMAATFYPGIYPPDYDYPVKYIGPSQQSFNEKPARWNSGLSTRETIELFENEVDTARQEYEQTIGGKKAGDAPRPKLTVDLRSRSINVVPKEVVPIIISDVERLQLSYNQIALVADEFASCSTLKYLNLRDNRLKDIPKAILSLPQLEILDISKNKVSDVPDEIENMKSLRVFSIGNNNVQDLPFCLGNISTLRVLRLSGNPLNPSLRRIVEGGSEALSPTSTFTSHNENERDTILTRKILEYLKAQASVKDSGEDSSDGPLETPRALSRFPVQPRIYGHNTSGSESASDMRSPSFINSFASSRSHYRVASNQSNALHNTALRRPGLAHLALGNERNRSNSESVLQATQSTKNKRMGIVPKKSTDFGPLDETSVNRSSTHLRGQSHGSALRNGVRVGEVNKISNSASPRAAERYQGTFARRLSSVPEQKIDKMPADTDKTIKGAKGVLYSIHQVHPHISALASVIMGETSKRGSTEKLLHNSAMQIKRLDERLDKYNDILGQGSATEVRCKKAVAKQALASIKAQHGVAKFLRDNVEQLVTDADRRYIRTLLLLLSGSLNELSFASKAIGSDLSKARTEQLSTKPVLTIPDAINETDRSSIRDRSVTPTRERPQPERRWKNGGTVQSSSRLTSESTSGAPTAVPLYLNGRSRSNSRAGTINSSASSSLVSTPRSGETFGNTILIARSRSASITLTPEYPQHRESETEQAVHFEKIWDTLSLAVEQGLQSIPQLEPFFVKCLDDLTRTYASPQAVSLCRTLVDRTRSCMEMSEALKMRLSTVKLNDPEARNARDFWQLIRFFVQAYSDLMAALMGARGIITIPSDIKRLVRPVHESTTKATSLITSSSWNGLTFANESQNLQLRTPIPTQNGFLHQHHRPRGSGGSNSTASSSPYTASIPATPLSAALGPAAQATVPATPVATSASLDRSFEGNVFQRAESYLAASQTMVRRFDRPR